MSYIPFIIFQREETQEDPVSVRKLQANFPTEAQPQQQHQEPEPVVAPERYRLWECGQLTTLLTASMCGLCKAGGLSLVEDTRHRRGWCTSTALRCSNLACKRSHSPIFVPTSPLSGLFPEVNRAGVLAMRTIGKGRAAAAKFSALMGLPPPIRKPCWADHTKAVLDAVSDVCEDQMRKAAERVPGDCKDGYRECAVSGDGSWISRGMSSHYGMCSVISNDTGEVLNRHVMCNNCHLCNKHSDKDKNSLEYLEFMATHLPDCPVNHEGSAASMESAGIEEIFARSIDQNQLCYKTYIGDGDSTTYRRLVSEQPYGPDVNIEKAECVGHVQKRMGSRLRKLLEKCKGDYFLYISLIESLQCG